jgi:pimeloyl-ACP methyl ester carboxylesterase
MVNKLILVDAAIVESSNNNILLNIINFDPIRRWGNIFLSSFYTKETFSNTLKSAFYDKDEVTDNTIDGYYLPLEIDDWQDSLLGISRDSNNNVLSEPLSKLDKPTLIIWGSNDSWVPIDNGKALQNKIMNSMFVEISNSGHLPMEDNPKEFNNTVLEFVRQD